MIPIGGKDLWSEINKNPDDFKNIKVFAFNNYKPVLPVSIKNLSITIITAAPLQKKTQLPSFSWCIFTNQPQFCNNN